jgi:Ca-activated chloride channel family protein
MNDINRQKVNAVKYKYPFTKSKGGAMKTTRLIVALLITFSIACGMTIRHPAPAVALDARLNSPFISERGGTVFMQISITTANIGTLRDRKPMNIAIVIDRSGSMSSERKMEYARQAFISLIDQLQPNDILSVIVYDDAIDILRRAHRVGNNRSAIKRLVDEISPRGSTNLGGGLHEGLIQAAAHATAEYVNRVVLLSDGLANVGMTDPSALNSLVKKFRRRSISVTTMGVGLDYNENLMMGIAESGGGNYYFIERAHDLASIVRKEFDMISSVLAQNASILVTPGKGVRIADVIGCEFSNDRNTVIIPVGDLYANDRKEFTIELTVPEGRGTATVATGELRYESDKISRKFPAFSRGINYTRDIVTIEKNRDMSVQAHADVAVSTRKVEQAMKALDEGDAAAAEQHLEEAKDVIAASPAATSAGASGEAVRSQLGRIESYKKSAKEDDARRAKKAIQFDNYKTQKQK